MNFSETELYYDLIVALSSIFALINPFNNLPQCLSMTEDISNRSRKKIFISIIFISFLIVVFFTLTGQFIMHNLFRIELYHLRIAGGIILISMGLKKLMFPADRKADILSTDTDSEMIRKSIVPMAFPMIVGPGTLSTVIVMSNEVGLKITLISSIAAFLFMLILFYYSSFIERIAGKLILHVVSRIMQVFIVAIGVRILSQGVQDTIIAIQISL